MVTLRIFLFGLIALVPRDGIMTVLLIDATNPPPDTPDGCHFHRHRPIFAVHPSNVASSTSCKEFDNFPGLCGWRLGRHQIDLPDFSDVGPVTKIEGVRGGMLGFKNKLPKKSAEGADFSWVPRLKVVSGLRELEVNPINIDPLRTPGPEIVARVFFPQGQVSTCHLSQLQQFGGNDAVVGEPCEGADETINVFEFRPLEARQEASSGVRQALADGVVVKIEGTPTDLAVMLSDFKGKKKEHTPRRIELKTTPCSEWTGKCIDLLVLNVPDRHHTCPAMGLDFALLYLAAQYPPALLKRAIPYRKAGKNECISAAEVPINCDSLAVRTLFSSGPTPEGRPICPMGSY